MYDDLSIKASVW